MTQHVFLRARRKTQAYRGTSRLFDDAIGKTGKSERKILKNSSTVLLAIAFSIYIRVINRLLYQRRGLMFDVSDPIFRFMKIIIHRLIKSVSYSVFKVWTIHIRYVFLTFCTSSALRNLFLDAHHMQNRMLLKKPTRCSALTNCSPFKRAFSYK